MKRALGRTALVIILVAGVIYAGDLASFYLRRSLHKDVYDIVQVDVVNVIPEKGNKAEYVPQGTQAVSCVRTLLPHDGKQPCWYVRRHTTQEVNF